MKKTINRKSVKTPKMMYNTGGEVTKKDSYEVGDKIKYMDTFRREENDGTIYQINELGTYIVSTGMGVRGVQKEEVIGVYPKEEPKKKRFGLFAEGGEMQMAKRGIKLESDELPTYTIKLDFVDKEDSNFYYDSMEEVFEFVGESATDSQIDKFEEDGYDIDHIFGGEYSTKLVSEIYIPRDERIKNEIVSYLNDKFGKGEVKVSVQESSDINTKMAKRGMKVDEPSVMLTKSEKQKIKRLSQSIDNMLSQTFELTDSIHENIDKLDDLEYRLDDERNKLIKFEKELYEKYGKSKELTDTIHRYYAKGGEVEMEKGGQIKNYKTLLRSFERAKPSISLYIIARDVAEDFMSKKFDKEVDWEKLSIEEKTEYNNNYRDNLDKFYTHLVKEFLRMYYSDNKVKLKVKGQNRETIDSIKRIMKSIAKEYPKSKYGDGGSIAEGNYHMILSQAKEVKHHVDELQDILKNEDDIEAWVVAKMENVSSTLSDITHYLDGKSDMPMAKHGMEVDQEYKVIFQDPNSGEKETINVLASSRKEAERNALDETSFDGWEIISINETRMAKRGIEVEKIEYPAISLKEYDLNDDQAEIYAFIESRQEMQRQYDAIRKNLMTKIARGQFDESKAPKAFMKLIENGTKLYSKFFDKISLSKKEREEIANNMVFDFYNEAEMGNYENETFLPKKYLAEDGAMLVTFDIYDEDGDLVGQGMMAQDVMDYANTIWYYDMMDEDGEEIEDIDVAIDYLEQNEHDVKKSSSATKKRKINRVSKK